MDSHDRRLADVEAAEKQVQVTQVRLAKVKAGAKIGEINAQKAAIERVNAQLREDVAAKAATNSKRPVITIEHLNHFFGYIFQAHHLLKSLTARQNIELITELHETISDETAHDLTEAMLCEVGLGERMDYYPENLSGGQQQRVAIARALVSHPTLVLADEPTAALDSKSGRDVVDIMQRLTQEQGCTILMVTHDSRILDIADRIVHLEDGCLKRA